MYLDGTFAWFQNVLPGWEERFDLLNRTYFAPMMLWKCLNVAKGSLRILDMDIGLEYVVGRCGSVTWLCGSKQHDHRGSVKENLAWHVPIQKACVESHGLIF